MNGLERNKIMNNNVMITRKVYLFLFLFAIKQITIMNQFDDKPLYRTSKNNIDHINVFLPMY